MSKLTSCPRRKYAVSLALPGEHNVSDPSLVTIFPDWRVALRTYRAVCAALSLDSCALVTLCAREEDRDGLRRIVRLGSFAALEGISGNDPVPDTLADALANGRMIYDREALAEALRGADRLPLIARAVSGRTAVWEGL